MRSAPPRWRKLGAVIVAAALAAGMGALVSPAVADDEEQVIYEEDFSQIADGDLPADWNPVLGDWGVVDGRLQSSSSGSQDNRIGFGPDSPENFRLEISAEFVDVENAARWMAFGLDYHPEDHWGVSVAVRSETTAHNGVEFLQREGGSTAMQVFPGPFDMETGIAHDLVF